MSPPILYAIDFSPPCRSVRLTAAAIGLELDIKKVNLLAGEHKQENFTKINPFQTVPTLDDNGTILWDSHAICIYLISKYGSAEDVASLHPSDHVKRARIDQRMHFDTGVLYPASRAANVAIFGGCAAVPQQQIDNIHAALATLEKLLDNHEYLVGHELTVADLCCAATVTTMEVHVAIEADRYPAVRGWLNRVSQLPYFDDLNTKPIETFRLFIESKKEANK